MCSDFMRARHVNGRYFHGILEMDFFQHRVIRIDFDHRKLQLLKSLYPAYERYEKPIRIGYNCI